MFLFIDGDDALILQNLQFGTLQMINSPVFEPPFTPNATGRSYARSNYSDDFLSFVQNTNKR